MRGFSISPLRDGESPSRARFDHEEVGSDSTTGAGGPVMVEAMQRVSSCFAADAPHAAAEALHASTRRSFCMSADSAHAVHPNYAARHEAAHAPILNKGIVIKTNDQQRYATTSESGFVVRELARLAGVDVQEFMVKNDCPCGSTIGPILSAKTVRRQTQQPAPRALPRLVGSARPPLSPAAFTPSACPRMAQGMLTVDLGAGCWSMHSIRETVGVADVDHAFTLFRTFFSSFAELDRKCAFRTSGLCRPCPPKKS